MKKIELVKGIQSSIIGFGCAPILGAEGANKSRRALECAINCGVNHFDLARSYGYGEAEQFVGKILGARRKDMVIASKFGIKANAKAQLLRPIKPLVRFLKNNLKQYKETTSSKEILKNSIPMADTFHYRISFNEIEMIKSLEESFKALKTDYLDYFFIHEPLDTIKNIDELTNIAYKLKKEGKIRAFGIAFMNQQENLHSSYLNTFDLLQFNLPTDDVGYKHFLENRSFKPNIIFSPLKTYNNLIMAPSEKLKKISSDFHSSVILTSMLTEKHIIANTNLFRS